MNNGYRTRVRNRAQEKKGRRRLSAGIDNKGDL
jgi:hypothetical protein